MQGARAPALASAGTSGNPWPAGWEGDHTEARAKHPATAATGLHRLFLCSCFLGKSPETHCSVAGPGPSPVRWRSRPSAPVGSGAAATPAEQHQRPQHRTEHRHRHPHGERPVDASAQKTATTPGAVSQQTSAKKRRRNSTEGPLLSSPGCRRVAALWGCRGRKECRRRSFPSMGLFPSDRPSELADPRSTPRRQAGGILSKSS
jgi:hypothetical protein